MHEWQRRTVVRWWLRVLGLTLLIPNASIQNFIKRAPKWHYFFRHWSSDGVDVLVRQQYRRQPNNQYHCTRRSLYNNQISGTIPTSVALLTELTSLYVSVRLRVPFCRN